VTVFTGHLLLRPVMIMMMLSKYDGVYCFQTLFYGLEVL